MEQHWESSSDGAHVTHNPQPTSAASVSSRQEQRCVDPHSLTHLFPQQNKSWRSAVSEALCKRFCPREKHIGSPPASLIFLESVSHLLLSYCLFYLGCDTKCRRMSILNNRNLFASSSGDWGIQTQSCSQLLFWGRISSFHANSCLSTTSSHDLSMECEQFSRLSYKNTNPSSEHHPYDLY